MYPDKFSPYSLHPCTNLFSNKHIESSRVNLRLGEQGPHLQWCLLFRTPFLHPSGSEPSLPQPTQIYSPRRQVFELLRYGHTIENLHITQFNSRSLGPPHQRQDYPLNWYICTNAEGLRSRGALHLRSGYELPLDTWYKHTKNCCIHKLSRPSLCGSFVWTYLKVFRGVNRTKIQPAATLTLLFIYFFLWAFSKSAYRATALSFSLTS